MLTVGDRKNPLGRQRAPEVRDVRAGRQSATVRACNSGLRWLAPVRGAVLAALVTLLTATGHLLGGGTLWVCHRWRCSFRC